MKPLSVCQVVPSNPQPGLRTAPVSRGAAARSRPHRCAGEVKGSVPAGPGQDTAGMGTHHGLGVILACGGITPLYHDLRGPLLLHRYYSVSSCTNDDFFCFQRCFMPLVGDTTCLCHYPWLPEVLLWRVQPGAGKAKL